MLTASQSARTAGLMSGSPELTPDGPEDVSLTVRAVRAVALLVVIGIGIGLTLGLLLASGFEALADTFAADRGR